jgi:hypothetical protein
MLPNAPSKIEEGLYAGSVADPTFPPRGFLEKRLAEKKWVYALVTTPEVMAAFAIVDAGYLASGFCAVFDRGSRRLLVDENPVLPSICATVADKPGSARLIGPGIDARMRMQDGKLSLKATWGPAEADLMLDVARAPQPMTAIAPLGPPGRFDFTQKTVLVPVEGEIRAGNARFDVSGQHAGLDYTHGLFVRETAWRWAFGMGGRVGFNFSEGFLQGAGENVAWIDGEPRAVGPVRFGFAGSEPLSTWRIRSEDGRVDLMFRPEGYRAQTVDLKLIASRYLQPFGTFSGKLHGVDLEGLAGVTEDHIARW